MLCRSVACCQNDIFARGKRSRNYEVPFRFTTGKNASSGDKLILRSVFDETGVLASGKRLRDYGITGLRDYEVLFLTKPAFLQVASDYGLPVFR